MVYVLMSRPGKRKLPLSYCIRGLSRKIYLYIFEVDPLKSAYSRQFDANSARIQPGIKKTDKRSQDVSM